MKRYLIRYIRNSKTPGAIPIEARNENQAREQFWRFFCRKCVKIVSVELI